MAKFLDAAWRGLLLILAALLLVWFFFWLFGIGSSKTSISTTTAPIVDTRGSARVTRSNPKKEKWYQDCTAQSAPVTSLGGGVLNCNRPSRVETFIDDERVE